VIDDIRKQKHRFRLTLHLKTLVAQFINIFRGELKPEQGYFYIAVEIVSLQRKTRRLMEERVMFTGNVDKEIVTASNNS
jgi:cytochrome c-type biogenesis protein CcmE